jgi:ABC-type multidrug transport system ATPase subunit
MARGAFCGDLYRRVGNDPHFAETEVVISVDRFTKQFGRCVAAQDVTFDVKQGEVFAFLGPNGSGKTTTMKAIVGLNIPTSGRILVNGIDVHRHPTEARELTSYLPQRVVFPENLTAREVVRFYARIRNISEKIADEILEKAGCNGFSDKYVGEYSGGMIQRLGLAVVSLPDVPILLFDEPTANLDPQGVKQFREFILEQKEQRRTIIFSTHLLAEAEQLADRVAIFVGGKLVARESVETLKQLFHSRAQSIEDLYLHYVGEYHDTT